MKKLLLILLLLLPAYGWGGDFYVDATSGNDGYLGSSPVIDHSLGQGPWKSIEKVISSATSGDAVYFKRGETWAGSKLHPLHSNITYGAYGQGALPRIIGPGTDYAFQINSRSNITVQDIEFVNNRHTVMYIFSAFDVADHNTVRRCKISVTGTGGTTAASYGIKIFPYNFAMSGYLIDSNEFTNSYGGQGVRVEIYGLPLFDATISNNNFHDIRGAALFFYGDKASASSTSSPYGVNISKNRFTNIDYSAITTGSGLRAVDGHPNYIGYNTLTNIGTPSSPNVNAMQLNWVKKTIVEHNSISNVMTSRPDGDGIEMDIAFIDARFYGEDNIVRYNIVTGCNASSLRTSGINVIGTKNSKIYYNIAHGNQIGISLTTAIPTGNLFFNNVLDSNGYGAVATDATLRLGSAPPSVWKNNIFSNNTAMGFLVMTGSALPTEDHNLWFNNADIWNGTADGGNLYLVGSGMQPLSATSVLADPLFVSSSAYRLDGASPAIGAGVPVGLTRDLEGKPVSASNPDLGAVQGGYFALTLASVGAGSGSVLSEPAGISCGSDCFATFPAGTQVTLRAVAAAGSAMAGWSEGGCSGSGPCTLTLNSAKSVTATFAPAHTLALSLIGSGGGAVNSSPGGIACLSGSSSCSAPFPTGVTVALHAAPDGDSTFGGWGGACQGNGTCSVTMTANRSVNAAFVAAPNARIGNASYDTLSTACTAAGNGATILARGIEFSEDLIFQSGNNVILKGGYGATFSSNAGSYTALRGSLKIRRGRLTADRLLMR